jgi:dipeptidyl aminopeptidase/acylaminoacyl peptidase
MKNRALTTTITAVAYLVLLTVTPVLAAQQGDVVMRPIISESTSPVQRIAPVASDGFVGEAFLRKPPGNGPFPAVILIHGGAPRWPTAQLREFATHVHASRFLEAGYVVVSITRRDLQFNLAPDQAVEPAVDAVAVVDYLKDLRYVDPQSIVVRGTSVGGYLALEVGAARDVAAIMVEEPFSMPFVGLSPGPNGDQLPDTHKVAQLNRPILLVRGDQTANINDFNRDVFIPALQAAGKSLKILTYPGELHSFAFYNSPERTLRPTVALKAFEEIDAFFRENLKVQPSPLDVALVGHEEIKR